ncbi:hypothetical protein D3C81_1786980 [compost metagenome]
MQQNGIPGLEVVETTHQVRRRQAAHGHGRGGFETDGFRQLDQRRGRDQAFGTVGPQGVEKTGVGDTIAHLYVGHPCADGLHHAGRFNPHAVRHRDRVGAIAKIGVGIVQADRHMTKTDLAWTGFADIDLFIA